MIKNVIWIAITIVVFVGLPYAAFAEGGFEKSQRCYAMASKLYTQLGYNVEHPMRLPIKKMRSHLYHSYNDAGTGVVGGYMPIKYYPSSLGFSCVYHDGKAELIDLQLIDGREGRYNLTTGKFDVI